MTFVIGGYRAVERPGAGHHAAPVGLWRGEDLRTIDDVALTVLPIDHAETARAGVEQVRSLRHPHLLPVTDVVADDDRVAVICPWPRAGRLSELVARRGRLTPAETLTVLLPLAAALSVAHSQGFRHGGVCPESIWFDGSGRPLLGALAVGRIVADLNGGLPAGCRDVAPEVVRGESPEADPVTPAADLFSLGSVALFCLTGRSAWPADDPVDVLVQSAAGLWPDPPDDGGPALLVALVRAMLLDDPAARPSAAAVVEELAVLGEPSAIAFGSGPAPAAASADRWRGWSSARPGTEPVVPATGEPQDVEPVDAAASGGVAAEANDAELTRVARGPRSWFRPNPAARAELLTRAPARRVEGHPADGPGRPKPLAKAGIALLSGLLITLVAAQLVAWTTGRDDPTQSAVAGQSADSAPWSAIVLELDTARGAALAAADPQLLDAVYTDDSAEKLSDASTIEQLAARGWHATDAVHDISSVALLDPADGAPGSGPDPVRLVVVDVLPARPVVDDAGQQVAMTPARAVERRILTVSRTDAGYRISGIEPG